MTTELGTKHVVDRFLEGVEGGAGLPAEIWAPDAQLDATVPNWRFEVTGSAAVAATLSSWFADPGRLETATRREIEGGEVVEFDLTWVEHGVPHAAHQLHVVMVDGDRITAHTAFCGGRWPAALLAEMEAARVQ
jgi:hypothetical protein